MLPGSHSATLQMSPQVGRGASEGDPSVPGQPLFLPCLLPVLVVPVGTDFGEACPPRPREHHR